MVYLTYSRTSNTAIEFNILDPMQFFTELVAVAEALAQQSTELTTVFLMFQEEVARISRHAVILQLDGIKLDHTTEHLLDTTQFISYDLCSENFSYGRCYMLRSSNIHNAPLFAPLLAQLCGMMLRKIEHAAVLQAQGRVKHHIILTQRERELLPLLCKGKDDAAIAEQFSIAKATVKKHRENISNKLGITCRGELVLVAYREHLCSPLTWL